MTLSKVACSGDMSATTSSSSFFAAAIYDVSCARRGGEPTRRVVSSMRDFGVAVKVGGAWGGLRYCGGAMVEVESGRLVALWAKAGRPKEVDSFRRDPKRQKASV